MGLFDVFKGDSAQAMTPKMALGASLLYMMSADGNVEQEEIGQLVSVLGGDRAALDNALKYVRKSNVDTFLQTAPAILSEPQRRCILINLCDSLLADGSAAQAEQALFGRFLTAFGFSEDAFRPHFETIALKNDKSVFNT